jgi:uncharacterized membrane protein
MGRTFTEQVDIDATPLQVWQVLTDIERWPEWTTSMQRVQLVDPATAFGPGCRARVKQPGMPAMVWEVTSYEEGRSFGWTASTPGLTTVGEHEVEASGAGTRVTVRIVQSGPLAGIASALYGRRTERFVRAEAEGLQARAATAETPRS